MIGHPNFPSYHWVFSLLSFDYLQMATYKAQIGACNGYTSHEVQVSGVVTQSAAKKALQATHPGASIRSIQFISNKD